MDKSIYSARYAIFLKVLRDAREAAGLTQTQLAEKIQETQTFVSKCERGERRLDMIELRTITQAIGIGLEEFATRLERAIGASRSNRRIVRRGQKRRGDD